MELSARATTRPCCPGKEGKQPDAAPSRASTALAPRREAAAAEKTLFPPRGPSSGWAQGRRHPGTWKGAGTRRGKKLEFFGEEARGNRDFWSGNPFSAWATEFDEVRNSPTSLLHWKVHLADSCLLLALEEEQQRHCNRAEYFLGYLTKLLQNHTAYACDGEHLSLHCPRHSTISVQSAFYGQDYHMCSTREPETRMAEPINCVAPTSLQKVLDECQNLRSCQLLVNSRVFGPDLCPGTTKFLLVSFKCKPTEYKTKSACENQELKLHCQESKFLIIYSATYGRWAHEENVCSTEVERVPPFDCLSYTALEVLSKRCYGKQRCKIVVTSRDFGSPCLPGVTKYLNVSYACVPKFILTAVNPLVTDSKSSIKQNNGVDLDPKESRLPKKDGILVSNSLATFAYIR
ncbi:PREDICTED: protein eva-1 homolog C-like, partial [Phaethon lepturus]|uniref:protein eva-1 homolog C-like n=1 Tax=Phaethon lepturus TaxID=97097 RepID=UPI0005307651